MVDTFFRSFMIMPKLALISSRPFGLAAAAAAFMTRYEPSWFEFGGELGEQFEADDEVEDDDEQVEELVEPDEVRFIVSRLSFVIFESLSLSLSFASVSFFMNQKRKIIYQLV